jgi:hypothetical protein
MLLICPIEARSDNFMTVFMQLFSILCKRVVLARYEEVFDELEAALFLSKAMDFHETAKSCTLHDLITRSQAVAVQG